MKKIALFLAVAFLSVSTWVWADGQKTKVERAELPQEVINNLEDSEYRNWELQEAYQVQDEQTNEVHYELHLASYTDSENVRSVLFDQNGEIISDEASELGRTGEQDFEQQGTEDFDQPGFNDQGQEHSEHPGLDSSEPGLDGTEQGTEREEGQQY